MHRADVTTRPTAGEQHALRQVAARIGRTILHDKRAGIAAGLWVFGLLAVFVLPAPIKVTDSMLAAYQAKLQPLQRLEHQLDRQHSALLNAEVELHAEQGWFPWFASAKEKARVAPYRKKHQQLLSNVKQLELEHKKTLREANRELGLFSSHGVQQAKNHFWKSFEQGKVIGRRNTFWDGAFMILGRSREYDNIFEMLAQLVSYLVINFSCAMFFMFWIFLFGLPSLIWSFGASWVQAALFFAIATVGAASVMMTFLGLLAGASVTTVYGLFMLTDGRRRIGSSAADARRRLRGEHVPGYRPTQVGGEYYYRPSRSDHSHQE